MAFSPVYLSCERRWRRYDLQLIVVHLGISIELQRNGIAIVVIVDHVDPNGPYFALDAEDLVARCFKASAIAFSARGFKIA